MLVFPGLRPADLKGKAKFCSLMGLLEDSGPDWVLALAPTQKLASCLWEKGTWNPRIWSPWLKESF